MVDFRAGDIKAKIASDPNFCKTLRVTDRVEFSNIKINSFSYNRPITFNRIVSPNFKHDVSKLSFCL